MSIATHAVQADPVRILALCGSLRRLSYSGALLRVARRLAPPGVEVVLFDGLGALPLFNPDLEPEAPATVRALWDAVTAADAILISSPEYAHGVTGTIKNALDWLVGHIPFAYKPVAVINPSWQSSHADEALRETLRTMAADLVDGACVRIPVNGSRLDDDGIGARFGAEIDALLRALADHVERGRSTPKT